MKYVALVIMAFAMFSTGRLLSSVRKEPAFDPYVSFVGHVGQKKAALTEMGCPDVDVGEVDVDGTGNELKPYVGNVKVEVTWDCYVNITWFYDKRIDEWVLMDVVGMFNCDACSKGYDLFTEVVDICQ